MERKLATVRIVKDIVSILGADNIELALIDGWQVVVRKGDFKAGDCCVYVEIDSILPEKPEFEFLRPRNFRIKTIKLRKQLSQGIAFPISILEGKKYKSDTRESPVYDFCVHMDVTELLEIKKYEPYIPAHLSGLVRGSYPSFLIKTDEERVQNLEYLLEWCKGKRFYVSEKLNGTSMTCYIKDGEFSVCSRNLDLKETPDNAYWKVARRENIEKKLNQTEGNWAIHGELIGSGIQKNKYNFANDTYAYKIFSVFNINTGKYLDGLGMERFCADYGFYTVPILNYYFYLNHSINDLLNMADGYSQINPLTLREGLVFRTIPESYHPKVGRVSFKAVSNKYLLKHGDE